MEKMKNNKWRRIPILMMLTFALLISAFVIVGLPVAANAAEGVHTHDGVDYEIVYNESTVLGDITSSSNIVLETDITQSADVTISGTGTVVNLCLNGKTWNAGTNSIIVQTGATLNVCDCQSGGTITGSGDWVIDNLGVLTLTSGTVCNSNTGTAFDALSAVLNESGGEFIMTGGEIIAVFGIQNEGAATVSGGTISTITTNDGGCYGIWNLGGTLTVSGDTQINAVNTDDRGIGYQYGKINLMGGKFSATGYNSYNIAYMSSSSSVADFLVPGYLYYDENGEVITIGEPSNILGGIVTVAPCQSHTFVDSVCTICAYACTHTTHNDAGVCDACQKQRGYSVTVGDSVSYFDDMYEAFGATKTGTEQNPATIKLLTNVTHTTWRFGTVSKGSYVVLDLNGYTLTFTHEDTGIQVVGGSHFTLMDSSDGETGSIVGDYEEQYPTGSHLIRVSEQSTMILEGGRLVLDIYAAEAIHVIETSTLIQNGGVIEGTARVAVSVRTGSLFTQNGGTIISNGYAVGIEDDGSRYVLEGGTLFLNGNWATMNGGYFDFYESNGTVTINGGIFDAVGASDASISVPTLYMIGRGSYGDCKIIINAATFKNTDHAALYVTDGCYDGTITIQFKNVIFENGLALYYPETQTLGEYLAPGYIYYDENGNVITLTEGMTALTGKITVAECTNHTGGTATCDTLAVCTLCKLEYGTYYHADDDGDIFCDVCRKLPITDAAFPDATFRTYITENFDTDGDGLLSAEEIEDVVSIYADNKGISDLSGIKYFTNLQELYVANNSLTTLNLSNNKALTVIYCGNNRLTALDVSQNTELKALLCFENPITSLDVSANEKLEELQCQNCPNLISLKVGSAILHIDVSDTALTSLDLSECSQLDYIMCSGTNVTSLELPAHFVVDPFEIGKKLDRSEIWLDIDQKTMVLDLRDFVTDVSRVTIVNNGATIVGNYLYISSGATEVNYTYDTGAAEGSYPLEVIININNPHTHSFDENGYCADCGLQATIKVDVAFNSKYFTTSSFADALALAREGGYTVPAVITLFADVTVDEAVSLEGGTQILDLNGHKLTFTATNDTPFTLIAGTFTIRDSSAAQTGTIYHGVSGNEERTVIVLTYSTALVLESGTLDFSRVTAAIAVEDGSIMQQRGGLITTPILLNNGRYELDGGTIETTYPYAFIIDSDGSAWYHIEITGGTVSVKDTVGDGGLLDFPKHGCNRETVTITGGTFKNVANKPFRICVYNDYANVTVTGGTFEQGLIYENKWVVDEDFDVSDFLSTGYAYYDADGNLVVLADGQTEITEKVTIAECTHKVDYNTGKCNACGDKQYLLSYKQGDKYYYFDDFITAIEEIEQINLGPSTDIGTIKLYADITLNETVTVRFEDLNHLDLNGKTLTFVSAGDTCWILSSQAYVVIEDSSTEQTGKVIFDMTAAPTCAGVTVEGRLQIVSGTIEAIGGYAIAVSGAVLNHGTLNGSILMQNGGTYKSTLSDASVNTTDEMFVIDENASEWTIELLGGIFENGIKVGDPLTLKDLLPIGGAFGDEAGNFIDLEEGQKEIAGKVILMKCSHPGKYWDILSNDNGTHDMICTFCQVITSDDAECSYQRYIKSSMLISHANCTSPEIYYMSCACGQKNGETFEDGYTDPNAHTSEETELISNNDGTHNVIHSCCKAVITENIACTPADCTKASLCDCGYRMEATHTEHDFSGEYLYDEGYHWKKCKNCDVTGEQNYHTGQSSGDCTKPTLCGCGYVVAEATGHSTYTIFFGTADYHYAGCSTCTLPVNDEQLPHSFTETDYNDDEHWLICSDCNWPGEKTPHSIEDGGDCTKEGGCACGYRTPVFEAHSYVYTSEGNVITETCENAGCEHNARATVNSADTITYSGITCEAYVNYYPNWGGGELSIVYSGETYDGVPYTDAPRNAGNPIATISIGGVSASKGYEIEKCTRTVEQVLGEVWVASPTIIFLDTPISNIVLNWENTSARDTLTLDDGQQLTLGTHAYNCTYHIADSNNYHPIKGTVSITVVEDTLQSIAVTTPPYKTTYEYGMLFYMDGMVVTATYASGETKVIDNDDLTITPRQLTVTDTYVTITYEGLTTTQEITVNPRVASNPWIWLAFDSYPYTGQEIYPDFRVCEDRTGDIVIPASEYTVEITDNIQPGTATITISDVPGGNYDVSGSITFEITKASLRDVSVSQNGSLTYTGNAQTPTVNANATTVDGAAVTFTYCLTEDGTYTAELPTFTNAGTYTVYFKANAANHNETGGSFEIVVGKATNTWEEAPTIQGWTYGEYENAPTATPKFGVVDYSTFAYRAKGTVHWYSNPPTDAGIYEMRARIQATDNWERLDTIIEFEVKKVPPTVDTFDFTPPTNLNACDGLAKEATVTVKEGIEGVGSVTIKYFKGETELTGAPTTVGTYTVKIEVAEGANFFKSEELLTDDAWTFTFDITDEATHTGVTLVSNGNETHDKVCTVCEKVIESGIACSGTTTDDCDKGYKCSCGGYFGTKEHNFSGDYLSDDEGHWHKCADCSATDTKLAHTPEDDGSCLTAVHCSVCDAITTPAKFHSFTNACDTSCNNTGCTHTRMIEHTPEDDDGDCTTDILCSVCDAVTTKGNASHTDTDGDFRCDECDSYCGLFEKLHIALGEDITVYYYVLNQNQAAPKMRFTVNDHQKTVDGVSDGDLWKFAFDGVAPQWIGDTIKAELIMDDTVLEVKEYSVLRYLNGLKSTTAAELGYTTEKYNAMLTLINDLLIYGGAAQTYTGHKTDALVSEGIVGSAFEAIASTDTAGNPVGEVVTFNGMNVYFNNTNRLVFRFSAADLSGLTFTVLVNGGEEQAIGYTADGESYIIMTDAIKAIAFDDIYTITAYQDGVRDATLSYSVRSYVYSKQDGTNPMAELARATYNYGLAARAFAEAQ